MRIVYVSIGLSLLCLLSCRGDQKVTLEVPAIEKAELEGTWKMHEAFKGNSQTKLLDNAFFVFDSLGKIVSNIQGDETAYPYTLEKNKISISNDSKDVYKVLKMTSDTLILATKIRNFDFKFITTKSIPEE